MAIIQCNECQREISDKATSCPSCGAPGAAAATAPNSHVNTTREGGKYELAGFLMIIVGMITAMGSEGLLSSIGGSAMAVGFCVFIYGRFN